jgi:hypothetical protein
VNRHIKGGVGIGCVVTLSGYLDCYTSMCWLLSLLKPFLSKATMAVRLKQDMYVEMSCQIVCLLFSSIPFWEILGTSCVLIGRLRGIKCLLRVLVKMVLSQAA